MLVYLSFESPSGKTKWGRQGRLHLHLPLRLRLCLSGWKRCTAFCLCSIQSLNGDLDVQINQENWQNSLNSCTIRNDLERPNWTTSIDPEGPRSSFRCWNTEWVTWIVNGHALSYLQLCCIASWRSRRRTSHPDRDTDTPEANEAFVSGHSSLAPALLGSHDFSSRLASLMTQRVKGYKTDPLPPPATTGSTCWSGGSASLFCRSNS